MASDTQAEAASSVQFHTRTYASEHREALERDHWGRSALMRDGEVIEIFDAGIDAYDAGIERFGQGNFATKGIGAVSVGYRVVRPIG